MVRSHPAAGWLVVVSVCLTCAACRPAGSLPVAPQSPVVTVSLPIEREVADTEDFLGRTDAVDAVEIRARVSGHLAKIDFTPGAEVKKNQLLFEIDSRPYNLALKNAEGQVALLDARIVRATADFARAEELLPKKAIAHTEYDRIAADLGEARASLQSATAAVDRAKLDVEFSQIVAPLDGKISRNLISEGNLVLADSTLLTTIVAMNPMLVYFDVDERTLLRLQKLLREGKLKTSGGKEEIFMALANDQGYPHRGVIDFIENRVNPSTGTLQLRAVFPNPKLSNGDRLFTPGLFARLRVPVGLPYKALLVPEEAIGTDQGQKYLLVVDGNNVVQYRRVQVGRVDGSLRVIQEGLKPGERVIVNGLQRARPGSAVQPETADQQKHS
jgi:RND family efflux transporter MFP subunit